MSKGGEENWNGGQTGTDVDAGFTLTQVYDTDDDTPADSHFSFLAITNTSIPDSMTTFDNVLISTFNNLRDGYVA
jgi:hypothetical protein